MFAAVKLLGQREEESPIPDGVPVEGTAEPSVQPITDPSSEPSASPETGGETDAESPQEASETPEPTATPVPEGAAAQRIDGYIAPADWGVTVPERETAVYDSFFDNACMIGNSLMEGFQMWSGVNNCRYICQANMWVNKVLGIVDLSPITLNPDYYDSVYLMFGLNEVGNSVDSFIQSYSDVIDFIRQYQTTATIYVISVTPVTAAVDADPGEVQKMDRIDNFNEKLKEMCGEKGCWYLDLYSLLVDEDGYLSADYAYAGDGKHLEKSGYLAWADYMRTHYVDEALLDE